MVPVMDTPLVVPAEQLGDDHSYVQRFDMTNAKQTIKV